MVSPIEPTFLTVFTQYADHLRAVVRCSGADVSSSIRVPASPSGESSTVPDGGAFSIHSLWDGGFQIIIGSAGVNAPTSVDHHQFFWPSRRPPTTSSG